MPKICVPLTGASAEKLESEIFAAKRTPADMLEWRADFFGADDFESFTAAAKRLRAAAGETPLLFTFRTKKEGGERDMEAPLYAGLIRAICETGCADLIDAELFTDGEICGGIADCARKLGVKTIISSHDFEKTPPRGEITERIKKMRLLGADIPKIAVMPQSPGDVLELLAATLEIYKSADYPVITISMGKTGAVSRVSGAFFGSCLTFGAVSRASAPGQLDVCGLKAALEMLQP